jgi:sn-glycerol 3-phosphate transport system substrate-binding protein
MKGAVMKGAVMKGAVMTALLSLALVAQGQVGLEFWHSMQSGEETVQALADAFNAAQAEYRVVPRYVGSYAEAQPRILAAASSGSVPALYQAEIAFFPRLAADGALEDLSGWVAELPDEMVTDFFPGLWAYGEVGGARYGLPWNSSTPVLFYNATAFRQRGVSAPSTWAEFETAAARMTTRQTQGFVAVAESWTFEAMVNTRGGRLVTEDGRPNLNSPEAVAALAMVQGLVERRQAIPRSLSEVTFALLDMVRTRGMMIFASIANWPDAQRYAVAFDIAAAPIPTGGDLSVPLGGAQLVVMRAAPEGEKRGAFAFWEFLMAPENLQTWVEASFYIPVRRSALPLLEPWYAEDPNRRAALTQLEHAVPRSTNPEFNLWRQYLEEALERALKGGVPAQEALDEAQRRALE